MSAFTDLAADLALHPYAGVALALEADPESFAEHCRQAGIECDDPESVIRAIANWTPNAVSQKK
jgi:hypothetical protein